MKHIGRWFAKVLGSALCVVLIFVMLPYASRLAAQWMPDLSGAALTQSATLAREIRSSARLETTTVDEQGSADLHHHGVSHWGSAICGH